MGLLAGSCDGLTSFVGLLNDSVREFILCFLEKEYWEEKLSFIDRNEQVRGQKKS